MKKLLLLSLLPLFVYAQNLQELVDLALQNKLIESKKYSLEASKEQEHAIKSGYYPSLSIGGSYSNSKEESIIAPDTTTTGHAKISVVLYDGGKRSALIDGQNALVKTASFNLQSTQNDVVLNVIYYYYSYLSAIQSKEALNQKMEQLEAEHTRLERFLSVGSATEDEIQKIISSIAQTKLQLLQNSVTCNNILNALEYLTGMSVSVQDGSKVRLDVQADEEVKRYDILALEQSVQNAKFQADVAKAPSLPTITLEDTYSRYDYNTYDTSKDKQNTIALNVQWKIFDFGSTSASYQAAFKEYLSKTSNLAYEQSKAKTSLKNAQNSYAIAERKIHVAEARLKASEMTYTLVHKKFQNGLVNNVAYLDALSDKYSAISELQNARNDLEYQKAVLLYEMGKEIKGSIQ